VASASNFACVSRPTHVADGEHLRQAAPALRTCENRRWIIAANALSQQEAKQMPDRGKLRGPRWMI